MEFDKEKIKLKIAISQINDGEKSAMDKSKIKLSKWIGIAACFVVGMTGVVFATNFESIKEHFDSSRGLGKGIDSAVDNGYIANTDMNYIEQTTSVVNEGITVDNVNVEAKIDNFLMDDYNLSVNFNFVFGENIDNYISLDNIHNIKLKDLIVRDEENRIIFPGMDRNAFEEYCTKYGLDYNWNDLDNEKVYNCGLNSFPSSISKEGHFASLMYNIYADGFPKSKKLNFSFSKIVLVEEGKQDDDSQNIVLTGNWNIDLDVPEQMYNRTSEYYKVISCDNEDFDIYTSKVSDTGFEIGVTISNIKLREDFPEELKQLRREVYEKYGLDPDNSAVPVYDASSTMDSEYNEKKYQADNEYNRLLNQSPYYEIMLKWSVEWRPIDTSGHNSVIMEMIETGNREIKFEDSKTKSYIENENGEKFYCSTSPSRKQNGNRLAGNKFDFYETFEMTKSSSTDKIKVVLYYYGEPVTIELEKMK